MSAPAVVVFPKRWISALSCLITIASLSALFAVSAAPASGDEDRQVALGVAVSSARLDRITDFESAIGREVDLVRRFAVWNDAFPTSDDRALLESRGMILSVIARENGAKLSWAEIAAAQPGDDFYNDMVAWANKIRPYQSQIWLAFHHEPEASANLANGNATQFKAAWQRFMTIMAEQGLDELLGRVWIMTDYSFQLPVAERRHAAHWYPGDEWVEAIAADAYNWYDCRSDAPIGWLPLRSIAEPVRDFGAAHPDEQLMLTEIGSVEDSQDPSRKASWFAEAQSLFKEPSYSQFTVVSAFDRYHDEGVFDCDWRITTSAQATAAFRALASDPFYGGTGPVVPTTTTTAAPGPGCTRTDVNGAAVLNWTLEGTPVVRRNGSWAATPGDTMTWTDTAPPAGATYEVRIWTDLGRVDLPCTGGPVTTTTTTVAPAPAECTGTVSNGAVTLGWTTSGDTVIRRSGSWLATIPAGTSTYVDAGAVAGASYLIRVSIDGVRTDIECTLDGDIVGPPNPVDPTCVLTVLANNAGVELSWNIPEQVQLRRNGNWLATVDAASYVDPAGTVADAYVARAWTAAGRTDYPCAP